MAEPSTPMEIGKHNPLEWVGSFALGTLFAFLWISTFSPFLTPKIGWFWFMWLQFVLLALFGGAIIAVMYKIKRYRWVALVFDVGMFVTWFMILILGLP